MFVLCLCLEYCNVDWWWPQVVLVVVSVMKWCYHGRRNDPNWVVRLRYSAPTDQTFHVEVWQDSESLLTKTQYETTSYRFLVKKLCEVLNGECLPLQKVQVQRMANCEATKISCSFCLELTSHSTLSPTMMFCLGWCGAALEFGGSNFWILLSATSKKTLVKLEGTKFLIVREWHLHSCKLT